MLKYNDLTKAQKRFVDAVLAEFPEYKKTGTVNRKELESIYWTLNDKRATGGEKVGFPNWLTAQNKVSRGVFQLPMPEAVTAKAKKAKKSVAGFAAAVKKNPSKYSPTTVKQANLATTLRKISSKRKKK